MQIIYTDSGLIRTIYKAGVDKETNAAAASADLIQAIYRAGMGTLRQQSNQQKALKTFRKMDKLPNAVMALYKFIEV